MNHKQKLIATQNPNTPIKTLETLATDEDWFVRRGVANNANTPIKTLETLATDEDWSVRCGIARNPNIPINLLETLAEVSRMIDIHGFIF